MQGGAPLIKDENQMCLQHALKTPFLQKKTWVTI